MTANSNKIFKCGTRATTLEKLPLPQKNILIFHILFNHHHTVVLSNHATKSVYVVDSLRKYDEFEADNLEFCQFKRFLEAQGLSSDTWKHMFCDHR